MFRWIPLSLFIYVWLRLILPLPLGLTAKAALFAVLCAASLKQQFFVSVGGSFFSPELPRWLIELYGAAFGALFLLFAFTLLKDILMIVLALARIFLPAAPRLPASAGAALILAVIAVSVSVYGTYEAQRLPRVNETEVSLPGLPPELRGFKIALLSDIHISASRRADYAAELVKRVNVLSPDAVLIAGDFIDGVVRDRSADIAPLSGLSAPRGIYGVLGNHEYYFNAGEWKAYIEETLGIKILLNEHAMIGRGGKNIAVAGVADLAALRFADAEAPDAEKALSGIPENVPKIILDHQPGAARRNAAAGADLQLSGHTHGGMVPGLAAVVKRFNGGFVSGWYDVGKMKLYVSPGTGIWNGFLLRIGVPAEITVMRLRGEES